jgi:nucleoside-diphosphate-sugar epimerase
VSGDITDPGQVAAVVEAHDITHIIHLAALQVPACRANPVLGANVNVTGTINVFEAARQHDLSHVALASSVAVYGPPEDYPPGLLAADAPMRPRTLYGVHKVANEGTARIYWQDHGISSTTLRPHIVYGVGRDQGMTSEPTKAMVAAVRGQDYTIPFSGALQFQLASDVARQFIAAADHPLGQARAFSLGTEIVAVQTLADKIMARVPGVTIDVTGNPLPFPSGSDASELHAAFEQIYETPLDEGIQMSLDHFKRGGE